MPPPVNEAAWIQEPKGELKTLSASYNSPGEGEIVIKVVSRLHVLGSLN